MTSGVYIYWDNSNVAQDVAVEYEGETARGRVQINFRNLVTLAHAQCPVRKIVAAESVPPELKRLWYKMEERGAELQLLERRGGGSKRCQTPYYSSLC